MSTATRINTYEAMFLFPQSAIADLNGTIEHLKEILGRADADVISMGKWDERRLAFDIKGNKRGVYIICYFRAPVDKMAGLERDCNLSERILRAMVLRADSVPEELMASYGDEQRLRDEIALRAEQSETADSEAEKVSSDAEETADV